MSKHKTGMNCVLPKKERNKQTNKYINKKLSITHVYLQFNINETSLSNVDLTYSI